MLIIGDNQLGLVDENGNTQLIKGQHNVRIPCLAVGGHSPLPHASYPLALLPSVELFPSSFSVLHYVVLLNLPPSLLTTIIEVVFCSVLERRLRSQTGPISASPSRLLWQSPGCSRWYLPCRQLSNRMHRDTRCLLTASHPTPPLPRSILLASL